MNMHTTNQVPSIVERSARIANHIGLRDGLRLASRKASAHRAYRRKMNSQMHQIVTGDLCPYEYDETAHGPIRLSSWDVW